MLPLSSWSVSQVTEGTGCTLITRCFIFMLLTIPSHQSYNSFKTWKWKPCRTHTCLQLYSFMYLDCHTEILTNRNTTLRNLNTDIRKVRHNTGQFRTYCSTSCKDKRPRTPDCTKWRNSWFSTNSLCKWEKPPGNCWSFYMKIKITVEIASFRCVLKSSNKLMWLKCIVDFM